MKVFSLRLCLMLLGWLVSCTPTETAPLSATRPIALATPVLAGTRSPTPAGTPTATPTATATPFPTPLSATDVWQTMTAFVPPPVTPPPVTPTPQHILTPVSGPVWRIQFRGKVCPDIHQDVGDCSKYSSDLDFIPSDDYIINSDGSGLTTLANAGIFLANYSHFVLFPNSFSSDGLRIAFATSNCTYVSDLTGNSVCLVPEGFPAGYGFVPDGSCLITYYRIPESESPLARVRVQENCFDEEGTKIIGIFDFPALPARPVNYHLSPQVDALLADGRMPNEELRLYLQEIRTSLPPLLLYTVPNEDLMAQFVAIRWLPDGSAIEFLLSSRPNAFFRVSRDGRALTPGINLPEHFQAQLGDWSPDGREFAFSHVEEDRTRSGLYIVNLQTGEWRQILSGFHISSTRVRTWLSDTP